MNIRPIRTEQDYQDALRQASYFFDHEPEPGTDEGDAFEVLLTLIESYETRHFPISAPDPVEAIKFRMEQGGLTPADLIPSIGQRNRVYEVLNRKRTLTLPMIRNLNRNFGIPVESLIGT
jgi:HTH-type transcriptional regulator/antitoxin HigA